MIGIIGSGNLGANAGFFIVERGVGDVCAYDIQEGLATGKALDMMEAAPVRGYRRKVAAADRIEDLLGADVILVAAGTVRTRDMKRDDLFDVNGRVVTEIAHSLFKAAGVVIIATEPVDPMVVLFLRESGFDPSRVMGLAGALHSTRLRYLLSREFSVSAENISALAIGRNSEDIIPLPRYCRISGVPVDRLLSEEKLSSVLEEMKKIDARFIEAGTSPFYGPSAAAADLVEAVCFDTRRIHSVSLLLQGEYGLDGVALSLPAVIGRRGIEEVWKPELTEEEQDSLRVSAEEIRRISGGLRRE